MTSSSPIEFIVPGQLQRGALGTDGVRLPEVGLRGRVKDSVRAGNVRSGSSNQSLTAVPGRDVVVLRVMNGPALVLHPETARDLLLAQVGTMDARAGRTARQVTVPAQLGWRRHRAGAVRGDATRGLGDVPLASVEIITDLLTEQAAEFTADRLKDLIDSRVEEGLYRLVSDELLARHQSAAHLKQAPEEASPGPILVLIHGTFVDTRCTFGKLWALHPSRVRELFASYGDRVYGLDHRTLGVSPIANAVMLAESLPAEVELHLLTHSRGGLVGEVLARVCSRGDVSQEDLALFGAQTGDRDRLVQLARVVARKKLKVTRMVRIACPARGTLLASKRLDAYISVFKWTLELAGVPVAPALIDFLGEVARRRAEPEALPGLAAMIPDSPLIQWLHSSEEPIAGELRVLAGDTEGDSVGSWLKTLLADAFFWTDNDLIVQTRSMYGGAPRGNDGASFLLDAGGKVTHFNYFSNERSANAIVDALLRSQPNGYRPIGPLSWAGESASGVRAGTPSGPPDSSKPAVFLIPGILGSHLKVAGKRVWLSLRIVGGLARLAYPNASGPVTPDSPIESAYEDLAEFLSKTHQVIPFPYDWRAPLEDEAIRLAEEVSSALEKRRLSGQPVRFLAHSMGGLLVRAMIMNHRDVWEKMRARNGARVLMLGTPNGGSWAPMSVLSGDDSLGNMLATVGSLFQEQKARKLMAGLPGFLQLQASLLDAKLGLDRSSTWMALARADLEQVRASSPWHRDPLQLSAYEWGVPPQNVLDSAVALRKRLDEQLQKQLPAFANTLALVVGTAERTPDGFEAGEEGFVYLDARNAGDGRVTLKSAMLPGVPTWRANCDHAGLPSYKRAFDAFEELLTKGDTSHLDRVVADGRETRAGGGQDSLVQYIRSRPSRTRQGTTTPPDSYAAVFDASSSVDFAEASAGLPALRMTVVNGNLQFIPHPLLVGHYASVSLTGTERIADELVGRSMSESLRAGRYPDKPGLAQVFMNRRTDAENPWRTPRPLSVIVVGLGEEGELGPAELSSSIQQGVIAWAQRLIEEPGGAPAHIELAATLVGSGGAGISSGSSARALAHGVRDANERLAINKWPIVSHLYVVELYLNRASDAWQDLQLLTAAAPSHFELTPVIKEGTGPIRRPLETEYRGANYDLIRAAWHETKPQDARISYALDTRRARSEVRAQAAQGNLIKEFVANASNDTNNDPHIGRTLFQLLIPIELEPFLSGTQEMVLELDENTAKVPWELLDTPEERRPGGDTRPWAIRTRLIRKLRTKHYRERVADSNADDRVLVIGEPLCDPKRYARLPGALAEARAVAARFSTTASATAGAVTALVNQEDARAVMNALLQHRYRIVHIAGHGLLGEFGGVVLDNDLFLGPREIESMRTVPQLVFVNCCHLAAVDSRVSREPYDRARFAASVAEALIRIGVKCVVAAGWAVEDAPAKVFATTFYDRLLSGHPFITAVGDAREAARALGGNTWAAYQCYGDPQWTYWPARGSAQPGASRDPFARIASSVALISALETLTVGSTYERADPAKQQGRIRHLEARFAARWNASGSVAEAFGNAYAAADAMDDAIRWYEKALSAEQESASFRAAEQLANLRARRGCERVASARMHNPASLQQIAAEARAELEDALSRLQALAAVRNTQERESLRGSAFKRLAMVEGAVGNKAAELEAIRNMATHYAQAVEMARSNEDDAVFYPALNGMAAKLIVKHGEAGWAGFEDAESGFVREAIERKVRADPDFWSVVGVLELRIYCALATGTLASQLEVLLAECADLHGRVPGKHLWSSVRDQLDFVFDRLHLADREMEAAAALRSVVYGYVRTERAEAQSGS